MHLSYAHLLGIHNCRNIYIASIVVKNSVIHLCTWYVDGKYILKTIVDSILQFKKVFLSKTCKISQKREHYFVQCARSSVKIV